MPLSRVPAGTPCCVGLNGSWGFTSSLRNVSCRQLVRRARDHVVAGGRLTQRPDDHDRDVVESTPRQRKLNQGFARGLRVAGGNALKDFLVGNVLGQPIAAKDEDG